MTERDYCRIATDYAKKVVSGKILACDLVKAACRRQLADLARAKSDKQWYRFDKKRAARICRFIERLPHVKGDLAKQKELIRLEAWQSFILTTFFGWVNAQGKRRFRRAYNEVARKNAKSTLSSGVGLYCLSADDEEGAEVYCLATNKEQASIVWKDASRMVTKSPGMRARFGIDVGAMAVTVLERGATFQALCGDPGDGQNPHAAIVDEYHEHKTSGAYDAMYGGQGARSQPIMWVITTAGSDFSGPCYQLRDYAIKVLHGVIEDESLFSIIFTLDLDDDWTDERVWSKANPNLHVSVSLDQLREAGREAERSSTKQAIFKTKRLNVWVGAGNAWMNMLEWGACADPSLRLANFNGRPAWIGLDLASKVDIAALEIIIPDGDRVVRFGRYYLPEGLVEKHSEGSHAHYAGWAEEGYLTLTPGDIIDFNIIKEDLRQLAKQFEIKEIGYDPHQATQLATEMFQEGMPMVEVRQIVLTMSPAMRENEMLVKSKKLAHDGDPVMTWMVSNVVAKVDFKDNVYPRKAVAANKIDGFVAHLIALSRYMARVEEVSAGIVLL